MFAAIAIAIVPNGLLIAPVPPELPGDTKIPHEPSTDAPARGVQLTDGPELELAPLAVAESLEVDDAMPPAPATPHAAKSHVLLL